MVRRNAGRGCRKIGRRNDAGLKRETAMIAKEPDGSGQRTVGTPDDFQLADASEHGRQQEFQSRRRNLSRQHLCAGWLLGDIDYSARRLEQIRIRGRVFKGTTATVSTGTPGNEQYRVFQQGATGFVSLQSVRETAEQRAQEFCGRKGRTMESLQETTASPPYILGNFPRIEIVFDCVQGPLASQTRDDPKYAKLVNLKNLLDGGVITQAEFDTEKLKILSQP
jgi:hypothetical protein